MPQRRKNRKIIFLAASRVRSASFKKLFVPTATFCNPALKLIVVGCSSPKLRCAFAARLSKNAARRRKPPVRKEERVPKWVHVVEE